MVHDTRLVGVVGILITFAVLAILGATAPADVVAQYPTPAITVVVTPQPTYEIFWDDDVYPMWPFYVINAGRPFTLTETLVASWYQPHPDVVGLDLTSMDQCELAELVPDWGCWLDVEVIEDGPGACDWIIWPDPIKHYYRMELQFSQPRTGPLHELCWYLYWRGVPSMGEPPIYYRYCRYRDNDPLHWSADLYLKARDKVLYLPIIIKVP